MFSRKELFLLGTLCCIQFSHIVDFMILMPMGPQLMRSFGIEPQQFSLLVSSYTLSAGISSFLASLFVDRFDRKTLLLSFYMGFTLGTIACGLAPNYASLMIARSLTGFFGGVLSSLILSIIADTFPLERRGRAIGINTSAFSLASVFGVPFSLMLATKFDWHAPFMFLGVMSVLALILALLVVPQMRSHMDTDNRKKLFESLQHVAETPNLRLAILFMFCVIFGQFTVITFLSQSLVFNAGLPEADLMNIYLVGGIVSILSSPLAGHLTDKYGRKKIFKIGAILSIFPVLTITHLGVTSEFLILTIVATFFFTMSARMVPAMAAISSAAIPKYRGSFMSVSSSVQQLALAGSSYLAGLIVTRNETGMLMNYNLIGYLSIAFTLVAIHLSKKLTAT